MVEVPVLEPTGDIRAARNKWRFRGQQRPEFARSPGPGQESVWDYPRPPVVESVTKRIKVCFRDKVLATTLAGKRVLETSGAPTYYLPPSVVDLSAVHFSDATSLCEWKGLAQAMEIDGVEVGWRYIQMFPEFIELYLWVSFYPARVNCYLADELARPQAGGYYGGWMTDDIVGPVKGSPGSADW